MRILSVTETVEDRDRPKPKRRPATPGALWRGLFGALSPKVALFAAAWVYSSCHLWWIILDLLGEDLDLGAVGYERTITLAGEDWTHPLRRAPGDVPVGWVIGLVGLLVLGVVITLISWARHGRGPARRWFFTALAIVAFWAWVIYLPDRAFLMSSALALVVIFWSVIRIGWLMLVKRSEKVEHVMQAFKRAVPTQVVFLLLTGFVLAYGPGTLAVQILIAPWWLVGMGGAAMAILVAAKLLLILAAALLIPWTASGMSKF